MRISTTAIGSNAIFNMQNTSERLYNAQQVISTGRRVNKLSDDPSALPDDLALHTATDNLAQYQKNLSDARGMLGASDVAVGAAVNIVRNARTLAVQAASDTVVDKDRESISLQIDGMVTALANVANTSYGSRYLFSGQRTKIQPFEKQGNAYVYKGGTHATGDADLRLDTGPRHPVTMNKPGDEVFNSAFKALNDLKANLNYGQTAKISLENLPQLDKVLDDLTSIQAEFGAKGQELQATSDRYSTMSTEYATFMSNIEDADIPSAVVELTTAQTAYQAALTASSRSFQQSLLDFLK